MVIWLLGISGSGKTTLGKELHNYLKQQEKKSFIVDGDIVRDFYNNDLGYTKEDRIENIKRIMLSAFVLEQNGIIPIVCNIAPFQELRNFAKAKFDDYKEIYLQRDISTITNKESVYNQTNVVGKDFVFDEPEDPFLTIDTSNLSIEESLSLIIEKLEV